MKIRNFKRAFNHVLLNVPDSEFSMKFFRKDDYWGDITEESTTHECNTVGCIIGHCSILDTPDNFYKYSSFLYWSEYFFGIGMDTNYWEFCFSDYWGDDEVTASKTQALLRLQYLIDNKNCPKDFDNDSEDYEKFVMPEKELKPYIL